MPDLPEPELGKVTTPSKGYVPLSYTPRPIRVPGVVFDAYNQPIGVELSGPLVVVVTQGVIAAFNADQRKDFMLLWHEAERQAEALTEASQLEAHGAGPLLDPDCRDGKCGSCVGAPCEHHCHKVPSDA